MSEAAFHVRFLALLRKETRQMFRDRSNLGVGLFLPVVLILLFGYGLSMDVKDAPVAVVLDDRAPVARDVVAGLDGSPFLIAIPTETLADAVARVRNGEAIAIVHIPNNFSSALQPGDARIQILLNGVDATTASVVERYIAGAIGTWAEKRAERVGVQTTRGSVTVVPRMWFNEAASSTWYLVPGLIVLIMTLIGAFLTSLLIAREWERGTLEALFVTPVRPLEIVLAKLVPYIVVGAIDLVFCLLAAKFLFKVPIRGDLLWVAVSSLLYLTVSLLLGLFISGRTRNQFQASQVALLTSFLPAMMLSGFVFDLRNMPFVVQIISQILPATHFMELIKTLFLAGDNWPMILRDCGILMLFILILLRAATATLRKKLD